MSKLKQFAKGALEGLVAGGIVVGGVLGVAYTKGEIYFAQRYDEELRSKTVMYGDVDGDGMASREEIRAFEVKMFHDNGISDDNLFSSEKLCMIEKYEP